MMNDPLAAAARFNDAVEATSVVGELRVDVANLKGDVSEIKSDVKAFRQEARGDLCVIRKDGAAVRSTIDRYAGMMVVIGAIVSLAATMVVTLAGGAIARALGL